MRILIKFALLAMTILAGMCIQAAAQQNVVNPEMVGGYRDVSTTNVEVRRAVSSALKKQSRKEHRSLTLVKINKAERQVVSGMNYRVCMDVREGRKGRIQTVTAVVYEPIRRARQLTSWQEGGCKDL